MAPTLRIVVRMLGIGAILVIIAVVSRQVYLRVAAQADLADAEAAPAARMLIRCETLHSTPGESAQARGHWSY
jgi:hypothetical protein